MTAERKAARARLLKLALLLVSMGGALGWLGWSATWVLAQNERGVVLTFGEVTRTVPPGIHITLPWPIETVIPVRTTEVRTMPVGFKMSDRARNNTPPSAEEVQWLTGDTNIVELQAMVLYTIKDPVDYLFGVSDFPDGRPRDRAVRKSTEAVLSRLMATMPIDEVLSTGKARLQSGALDQVQATLDSFRSGIQVSAINIIDVSAPLRVIDAFNDVSSARADKERKVSEAHGYGMQVRPRSRAAANRKLNDAEVYRNGVLNRARGAATSFLKLEQEVRKNPELAWQRIWLDAIQRMFSEARTIVVPPEDQGGRTRVVLPAGN